jgi:uncharacterized protein YbjT (DUF2867 family)
VDLKNEGLAGEVLRGPRDAETMAITVKFRSVSDDPDSPCNRTVLANDQLSNDWIRKTSPDGRPALVSLVHTINAFNTMSATCPSFLSLKSRGKCVPLGAAEAAARHRGSLNPRARSLPSHAVMAAATSSDGDGTSFSFGTIFKGTNLLDAVKEGTMKLGGGPQPRGSPSFSKAGKDSNTVFVAGSSGRLGIRIVYELAAAGYRVRAGVRSQDKADAFDDELDALSATIGQSLDKKARSQINLVYCDLQDEESIRPAIGNASRVVCAVGAAESEFTKLNAPRMIDYEATQTLIEVASSCNIDQFILVTSLGTGKLGFPAGVLNLFGGILIWKRKAEEALEQSGMRYLIVRPGGMERPKDDHKAKGYNMRLSKRDTLFGGTVSRLQIAELVTAAVISPDVASNKCVEVVAEIEAPEVSYESLLFEMPVEVDQSAREAAIVTIKNLATKELQVQAKIDALSSDLGDTRDRIAELQKMLKEAREEKKAVLKDNAQVLQTAQRVEDEIATLKDLLAQKKLMAEASKMVAAAQQKNLATGNVLSSQDISNIRQSVLSPPVEEEVWDDSPDSYTTSNPLSIFGSLSLGAPAAAGEDRGSEGDAAIEEPPVLVSKSNGFLGAFVGFLEGNGRRGSEAPSEVNEQKILDSEEQALPPPAPAQVPEVVPTENDFVGSLKSFRIRNLFGGSEYAFIDDLEGKDEELMSVEAQRVGSSVAVPDPEEAVEPAPSANADIKATVMKASDESGPPKSLFPNVELTLPQFPELPKLSFEAPKVPVSSASDSASNTEEARKWIADWKVRTSGSTLEDARATEDSVAENAGEARK